MRATRSIDGQPTLKTQAGSSPIAITRCAASSVAGKWTCASFVTAWRTLSSIEPETSPPCVCATGMFMYAAAIAVAIVSKRSATVTTTSGWSRSKCVGSSSRPRPVDFAIVAGRLALDDEADRRVRREAVLRHDVERVAEPLEHERRAGDELQLEVGVRLDRLERGLDPRVVRAAGDDDADLARSGKVRLLELVVRLERRARRSGRRPRRGAAPGSRCRAASWSASPARAPRPRGSRPSRRSHFSNVARAGSSDGIALLQAVAHRRLDLARTPSTSCASSSGVERRVVVGAVEPLRRA